MPIADDAGMGSRTRGADMFVDLATDPREGGRTVGDERAVLAELLRERIDGRLGQ